MALDLTTVSASDFKGYFTRDFLYAQATTPACDPAHVFDADITKAFGEAGVNFNPGLFATDDAAKIAYLYLAAHYLVTDFQIANDRNGLNSVGTGPVASRSVGPVSESYQVPAWVANDPVLSSFNTTRYGQKYLSIIRPLMIGNFQVASGWTTPW